jgi:hypothetical protein
MPVLLRSIVRITMVLAIAAGGLVLASRPLGASIAPPDCSETFGPAIPTTTSVRAFSRAMAGASSVDFQPCQSTANAVVVPIGADGRVSLFNGEGTTHAIADLVGWYH